ncbi:DUF4276 family protein [candidate division KSB1 bacterium]|nr:DUF4276 family protein [candidate division KSB1 bacterium]
MITLYIFTEERSAENVLKTILPQILPTDVAFQIYSHQGKQDLERALRTTLPFISRRPNARLLILRDQDRADCRVVKKQIRDLMLNPGHAPFLIRIACQELESWFLGDLMAIKLAYPRFKPEKYQNKAKFRHVDHIEYPANVLLKMIPEYDHDDKLPKLELSEKISKHLNLANNRSRSFNQIISGIKKLVGPHTSILPL